MNRDQLDRLFRDAGDARREPPARPTDLRRCDECDVYSKNVRLFSDNRHRCESCAMAHVNQAMREAQRKPVAPMTDNCAYCGHTGTDSCRDDNDRVGCRHLRRAEN